MQEYKLEILAPAWSELEEIADYYLLMVGSVSAKNITDQILLSIECLKKYPLSGTAVLSQTV